MRGEISGVITVAMQRYTPLRPTFEKCLRIPTDEAAYINKHTHTHTLTDKYTHAYTYRVGCVLARNAAALMDYDLRVGSTKLL